MQSEREPPGMPEPDERAAEEARAMFERAEAAWQRQLEGEDAAARLSGGKLWRAVLLGAAILAMVFLLVQQIARSG